MLGHEVVGTALEFAAAAGATACVRADDPDDPNWPSDEMDVAIEASGVAAGLDTCPRRVRRGGVVVQLGMLPPGQSPFADADQWGAAGAGGGGGVRPGR
ncbi:hypothetical protein SANTM175S_10182 [Streptomyces antimycoticus]